MVRHPAQCRVTHMDFWMNAGRGQVVRAGGGAAPLMDRPPLVNAPGLHSYQLFPHTELQDHVTSQEQKGRKLVWNLRGLNSKINEDNDQIQKVKRPKIHFLNKTHFLNKIHVT